MPIATSTPVETSHSSRSIPQSTAVNNVITPPLKSTQVPLATENDLAVTPVASPTFITQFPSNIEIDFTPLWLIITIAVVATVISAIFFVLIIVIIIIVASKRRQVTKRESLQNENSYQASLSLKLEGHKGNDTADQEQIFDKAGFYVPTDEARAHWQDRENLDGTAYYNKLKFFQEEEIYWTPASTTSDLYAQLASKKYREIPRNQLRIFEQLGSGEFGEVCKAVWSISGATKELAVKTLRAELPEEEKVRFLQEAAIMGQFSHPNVVKLYGVVTVGDPILICIELMTNGDLRSYLCSIDPDQQNYKRLERQLIRFSQQIASGMKYLSNKSFVHRDLAARNILLDDALTCKIGDFGMARDLMDDTYYTTKTKGAKIPVKWTAPEAIFYKKYSTDSDVWSYGMVLFEIWSVGKEPFTEFTSEEAIKLIQTGHCQPAPLHCPRPIYKLMVDCWNKEHRHRPSFEKICAYLEQPIENAAHQEKNVGIFNKTHADSDYDDLVANNAYGEITTPRGNVAHIHHGGIEMTTKLRAPGQSGLAQDKAGGPFRETQVNKETDLNGGAYATVNIVNTRRF